MKPLILFLTGLICLVACSLPPGFVQDQPASFSQATPGLTSLSSAGGYCTIDPSTVNSPTIFENPADGFFKPAGESSTGSQSSTFLDTLEAGAGSSVTLLQEIHDLSAQRRADLLPAASGWLHRITLHFHSQVSPYPAWDNPTGKYQQEEWLSLDSQGFVHAHLKRAIHDPGKVDDYSLLLKAEWTNVYPDNQSSTRDAFPLDPNYGVYEQFSNLVEQGQTLNRATIYRDCWYQGEKYTTSDGQIVHAALFRPDHHTLRWIKTWQVSGGDITLIDSIDIVLEERLSRPPDDVLAVLAQSTP